ncbi:MAG: hypothetical protein Q9182_001393 [Xanthomendoza sp. 2 TL-2023]
MLQVAQDRKPLPEAKQLVRSFSLEANANDDLMAAVQDVEASSDFPQADRWKHMYDAETTSTTFEFAKLDVEGRELFKNWNVCHLELSHSNIEWNLQAPGQASQSFVDIANAVAKAEKEWKEKKRAGFAKAQQYFHDFCSTMHAHSALLELLPKSSEYVSIFCGSLNALIKASVNHQKVAEGLSRALVEINDEVSICVREATIIKNEKIQRAVASLYAHIFIFLNDAISWYTSRSMTKLFSSFKENFYERFEARITSIKRISAAIGREAQLGRSAETRDIHDAVQDLRIGLERQDRMFATAEHERKELAKQQWKEVQERDLQHRQKEQLLLALWKSLGDSGHNLLTGQADGTLREARSGFARLEYSHIEHGEVNPKDAHNDESADRIILEQGQSNALLSNRNFVTVGIVARADPKVPTREECFHYSRDLEQFVNNDLMGVIEDRGVYVFAELSVVGALREWVTSKDSRLLALLGPAERSFPNQMSLVAANTAKSAVELRVPVIFHSCSMDSPNHTGTDETKSLEQGALLALAYSLIRQLINYIPIMGSASLRLSEARFYSLAKPSTSWRQLLNLLQDLLRVDLPLLVMVIDGLQILDDHSTEEQLREFIDVVKVSTEQNVENPEAVFKVLFTTSGNSVAILSTLSDQEIVLATQSRCGHSSGRARPGWTSLVGLSG